MGGRARSLLNAGKLEAALSEAKSHFASHPGDRENAFLLLHVLLLLHRDGEAQALARRVVDEQPDDWRGHAELSRACRQAGDIAAALEHGDRAIELAPDQCALASNQGLLLLESGQTSRALAVLMQVTQNHPGFVNGWHNFGLALARANHLAEAESAFRRVLQATPHDPDTLSALGQVLLRAGQFGEATGVFLKAARAARDDASKWQEFAHCAGFSPDMEIGERALAECGAATEIDLQGLAPHWSAWLLRQPEMAGVLQAGDGVSEKVLMSALACLGKPPAANFLRRSLVSDSRVEAALTVLRKALLRHFTDGCRLDAQESGLAALACQCFLNEYLWPADGEEIAWLDQLEQRAQETPDRLVLGLLGCYRPLHRIEGLKLPPDSRDETPLDAVLDAQWFQPRREMELMSGLDVLSPIRAGASQQVRRQYEENPYPRWTDLPWTPPLNLGAHLVEILPALARGTPPPPPERILVAGCGTGRHALQVSRQHPRASVLAIDLSASSLAYAQRKQAALSAGNLRFAQADILGLEAPQKGFDLIESVGVLHHLAEPQEGLKRLARCLAPGGLMKLGLYSRTGRAAILAARDLIASRGLAGDPDGIRQARALLLSLPDGHPARDAVFSSDFFSLSACRDLLFHVQERSYDPAEIQLLLDDAGLRFLGFEHPDPSMALRYRARFPEDAEATSLDNWAVFERETPTAFASMYVFWVARGKGAGGSLLSRVLTSVLKRMGY